MCSTLDGIIMMFPVHAMECAIEIGSGPPVADAASQKQLWPRSARAGPKPRPQWVKGETETFFTDPSVYKHDVSGYRTLLIDRRMMGVLIVPTTVPYVGVLQEKKWENAMTIDNHSWGYRRTASLADYISVIEMITNLTSTVSCGGNLLLNVGPTKDGIIPPIYEERLYQLGKWMKLNGEAIYSTKPWSVCRNDSLTPGIWYTTSKDQSILYATFSPWPTDNLLTLKCPEFAIETKVQLLGVYGYLEYSKSKELVRVRLPNKAKVKGDWVWTLKIGGAKNIKAREPTVTKFEDEISVIQLNSTS